MIRKVVHVSNKVQRTISQGTQTSICNETSESDLRWVGLLT